MKDYIYASVLLTDAARLYSRLSGKVCCEPDGAHWEATDGPETLARACAELGFDLVKRQPAPSATVTILPIDAEEEAA